MNRNVESHFATTAAADIQRSTFDRSQDIKFSFNVGELIPFFVDEVLPGDTFKVSTSKVVRLQTLLTPVMDNMYLDTYFFFVPNRLVWTHWKQFMGESNQAWLPSVTYQVPQIGINYAYNPEDQTDVDDLRVKVCDALDYLGVPPDIPATPVAGVPLVVSESLTLYVEDTPRVKVNALPWRAYKLIWDEWFRDENLQGPVVQYFGDTTEALLPFNTQYALNGRRIFPVSKYHDYFTSCLPAPQKSEPIFAPVATNDAVASSAFSNTSLKGRYKSVLADPFTNVRVTGTGTFSNNMPLVMNSGTTSTSGFIPSNLGVNILELRNAFQVQKFFERDARGGTRYIELIKSHFNVSSPDSRLQRPEYLGGNRIPISIHQIANQSQGENDFLGDLGALSLTTDRNDDFVQSFTEHGYILGLCCARYDHSYPQGLERLWSRKNLFDFYFPEFANLSEQAVLNKEIYLQGSSADNEVFGYQEAWADYRYKPNRVASEMRPGIQNSLASWHFADYYQSQPYLSSTWVCEDKANVDRTLAVTSQLANQIFCDIYVKNITTRPMPVRSIPGLADHH